MLRQHASPRETKKEEEDDEDEEEEEEEEGGGGQRRQRRTAIALYSEETPTLRGEEASPIAIGVSRSKPA